MESIVTISKIPHNAHNFGRNTPIFREVSHLPIWLIILDSSHGDFPAFATYLSRLCPNGQNGNQQIHGKDTEK